MFDFCLTIALIVLSAMLSAFLDLEDAALESLIELIPLAILTVRLWYNRPRSFMYMLGIINRNVKYYMTVKLEDCDINEGFYNQLCNGLKNLYGSKNGKEIKKSNGKYLWSTYLEVDSCLIEVTYNFNDGMLYIETKAKTKFKSFINNVEKIMDHIALTFSTSSSNHGEEIINVNIVYLDRSQEDIKNPFLTKFFIKFENAIIRIQYKAKFGTKFYIDNNGVSISGDNLRNIKKDIKKEMLLF